MKISISQKAQSNIKKGVATLSVAAIAYYGYQYVAKRWFKKASVEAIVEEPSKDVAPEETPLP